MNITYPTLATILLLASSCGLKPGESLSSADTVETDTLSRLIESEQPGSYVVETVVFAGPNNSTNSIPRVRSSEGNGYVESEINNYIKEFFEITSFVPNEQQEFLYSDVSFEAEFGQSVLVLSILGTYMAAYPSEVSEVMIFSLGDGQRIKEGGFTLPSLVKVDGYFPFLEKHWLAAAQSKFAEAKECAELEPGCSPHDVKIENKGLVLMLSLNNEDCYPHAAAACAPEVEVSVELDKAKPFLSSFGLKVLSSGYFLEKSPLKRFELAERLRSDMPYLIFMRVKRPDIPAENDVNGIGFVYPQVSIALQFEGRAMDVQGKLSGYLDMDNLPEDFRSTDAFTLSDERINFKGTFSPHGFFMTRECEVDDGQCTINFTWSENYVEGAQMVAGRWLSCDFGSLLWVGCSNEEFFGLREMAEGE